MMTEDQRSRSRGGVTILVMLILLLSLGLVVSNTMDYFELEREAYTSHFDAREEGTAQAAGIIEQQILRVERAADQLAQAISQGELAADEYKQALAAMLQRDELFYGGAIAFAPYVVSFDRRLYAPYFSKRDGVLESAQIEDAYDYTLDDQEWYVEAMASGSRWSQPYFDESVGDILMTTYSAVVYRTDDGGGREAIAVVTIDVAVDTIADAVQAFDLGGAGYAEILSDKGTYLYSPDESRVLGGESLFTGSRWSQDESFDALGALFRSGKAGMVKVRDPLAGTAQWITMTMVPGSGWRVMGVFAAQEIHPRTPELRHRLMFIILGVVIALCAALLTWQVVRPSGAVLSWPTAILVSLVLVLGISQVWRVAMTYSSTHDRQRFAITSEQALARETLSHTRRALEQLTEQPVFIPTGLYVDSMRFISISDIKVVGSVWQKFDEASSASVEPGVIFPGAARLTMSEPFITSEQGARLVRWQFSGEWRFRHQYTRYPLVKDVFSMGIMPLDMADNVLLIPDVDSYPYLAPARLPGISPDTFLLGWHLQSSHFELRPWRHNTTFGRDNTLRTANLPELQYSVEVEKAFVHSVISSLTPLVIALLISFITLLISTSDKAKLEFLRTGVGFDIGISTSIFFVVVLSHIGLRERIVSEEVFYLEYFYMLMYANLIWKCCHSILSGMNSPWLEKLTFGVSAKKAFFPVNCLLIFTFTWLIFYW